MTQNFKLKIATLNVKGLNNKDKQCITLTLLKSYKMDIILLQETNTTNKNTRDFLKAQWIYNSIWTNKTAILAGNKVIEFKATKIDMDDRVIKTEFLVKGHFNVYALLRQLDRVKFLS